MHEQLPQGTLKIIHTQVNTGAHPTFPKWRNMGNYEEMGRLTPHTSGTGFFRFFGGYNQCIPILATTRLEDFLVRTKMVGGSSFKIPLPPPF